MARAHKRGMKLVCHSIVTAILLRVHLYVLFHRRGITARVLPTLIPRGCVMLATIARVVRPPQHK